MNEILECIFCILISFFSGIGILTICSAIYLAIKEKQDWGVKRQKGIKAKDKRHQAYLKYMAIEKEKETEKNLKKDIQWVKREYFRGENVVSLRSSDSMRIKRICKWMWEHDFGDWVLVGDTNGRDYEVIFEPHNGKYMDADTIRIWIKEHNPFVVFSSPEYEKEFMGTGEETC